MNNPLLALQSQYAAVRDYMSPVLKESKFKEHGRITPEEFILAGDFLAYKFPVWQWCVNREQGTIQRDFLPKEKQYLICRNVPSLRRAAALDYTDQDEDAEKLLSFMDETDEDKPKGDDDDWVATHIGRAPQAPPKDIDEIPDMSDSPVLSGRNPQPPTSSLAGLSLDPKKEEKEGPLEVEEIPDIDDIPDMEMIDEGEGLEDDIVDEANVRIVHPSEADIQSTAKQNLLQVRTYDIAIAYDKRYSTPRLWLRGWDENKRPLTPAQIFQDVPSDHAFKTVTMEAFPHSGEQMASVHPCKHASVMKKFIDRMESKQEEYPAAIAPGSGENKKKWGISGMVRRVTGSGSTSVKDDKKAASEGADEDDEAPRGVQVDMYNVIFLKLMSSILPSIEIDSTTSTAL
uniref:Autophagy-related protein 3 n=1 Tax=Kwoniella bestiolae CBS 10118 TaxID=1296100 RepID=A0A1B9G9J3_9TREE|nr:preconditioning-inducible protein [Kwoniella bestiolae CBS 10118]OCF27689.1 preconditioning-inducible protein [Kwoniella bestiolae CBS 10118]